ncbi:hypothetical protein PAMP_013235 [Pampus punctatissimus]
MNYLLLAVSVLEARGILDEVQGACDSYVKVGMFPDSDPRDRQKTQMVPHCRNPIFLQTFYFVVGDKDLHKRLLFTMWNSDSTTRMSVLLGCMSFGVRSLMDSDKEVQGWYYLLGEELGRKKHLKVPTQHNINTTVLRGIMVYSVYVGRREELWVKELQHALFNQAAQLRLHKEDCFALAQGEMCSKGTVSARDSFVYISEAVLSNHGVAPETNCPENMQCLTNEQ